MGVIFRKGGIYDIKGYDDALWRYIIRKKN